MLTLQDDLTYGHLAVDESSLQGGHQGGDGDRNRWENFLEEQEKGLTYCFLLTGGCTLSRSEPERQRAAAASAEGEVCSTSLPLRGKNRTRIGQEIGQILDCVDTE